jgi:hypothetical protein
MAAPLDRLLRAGRLLEAEAVAWNVGRAGWRDAARLGDVAQRLLAHDLAVTAERLLRRALVVAPDDPALWSRYARACKGIDILPAEALRAIARSRAILPGQPLLAPEQAALDARHGNRVPVAVRSSDDALRRFDFIVVPFLQAGAKALHYFLARHPGLKLVPERELDTALLEGGEAGLLERWQPALSAPRRPLIGLVQHGYVAGGWSHEIVARRLARIVAPDRVVLVYREPLSFFADVHRHLAMHKGCGYDFRRAELPWFDRPIDPRAPVRDGAPAPPARCFEIRPLWDGLHSFLRRLVPATGVARALDAYRAAFPGLHVLDLRLAPEEVGGFMGRLHWLLGVTPRRSDPQYHVAVNPLMSRFLDAPQRVGFAIDGHVQEAGVVPSWRVELEPGRFHEMARLDAAAVGLDGLDGFDVSFVVPVDGTIPGDAVRDALRRSCFDVYLPRFRANLAAISAGFADRKSVV